MSPSARIKAEAVPPKLNLDPTVRGATQVETLSLESLDDFESVVATIMARFMNATGDLDALVDQTLAEVGHFLNVDRLTFFDVDCDAGQLIPRWQWFCDSAKDLRLVMGEDVSERFSWLTSIVLDGVPLVIDEIEQIPEDAVAERSFCGSFGIRSFAFVPASHEGTVVAAMSLDDYGDSWAFDERMLQRLQSVTLIIANARLRAASLKEIDELHRFEEELSRISTAFVNLPPDAVDEKIEAGLGVVARILGADVVTLTRIVDGMDLEVTHEWSGSHVAGQQFVGRRFRGDFPWLVRQQLGQETILIRSRDDWPPEAVAERNMSEQIGIESVLGVRFDIRGEMAGALSVNSRNEAHWSEELAPRLRLLGEVFGEAMIRRRAEIELQNSLRQIESLKERLEQENLYLRQEVSLTSAYGDIVGDSPALRSALQKAEQVAATDSTVLILGDTGTGKELMANAIHSLSSRKDRPLVKVNCAALPSSLVEAELFGREKGAFTGALTRELGRFEIADGSTILLDEISELSLELQSKLLRVLQNGEFERLGSSKTRKVDVRVLAATNRDLIKAIENKEFREDLYYRLNVFPIEMPPLRARIEDLPKLVWAFVEEFSESMGKTIETIPKATMDALKSYRWPGNIRELRNVIERAMIVTQGETLVVELPRDLPASGATSDRLEDVERDHITAVIEGAGWRISGAGGAAEILGIKPTTLEARMKKLGIERPKTA